MSGPTGRESDKFMLRLPDGMRDRIKTAADANNRSMNAEIVATLEEKYPVPVAPDDAGAEELLVYVLDGGDSMELRAQEANRILRSRGSGLIIRVLDQIRAKTMQARAIIVSEYSPD